MITLITDFGDRGGYPGIMKGVILSVNPRCPVIDITHHIAPQDREEAAFVLRSAYPFFPPGTIHLVVVDPGVGSTRKAIIIESERYRFVGPDNGVFSFVFLKERITGVREITASEYLLPRPSSTFHGRDIFAPAAAHLSLGVAAGVLGKELNTWVLLDGLEPEIRDGVIRAKVISVDHFGNLVSNLSRDFFEGAVGSRPFRIAVGGKILAALARSYTDGREGETLALFGSSGLLEISVRNGNCQQALQVRRGAPVEVMLLM